MRIYQFFVPGIEIILLSILIYYVLSFFWNTRVMDLLFGLFAFFGFFLAAELLQLPVLQNMMLYFINVSVLGLLILFQPEIRLALSKLSFKGRKYQKISEFDRFLDGITHVVYRLAEKRTGAIVVLENQDSLEDYATKSVILNAQFSPELLESIFATTTPLHDGAVIIRGTTILSAATILPLADDISQLSKSMGTRHRAGLGISQLTDALVIVVSEESGRVSIARDGIMTRGVRTDRFRGILRSIFSIPATGIRSPVNLWQWWKSWKRS